MAENFMEAKKRRSIGRIGKTAKKWSTAPKGPPIDSEPKSRRFTRSQRTTMMPTKETSAQIEPRSCSRTRNQKMMERRMGHWEIRARKPSGSQSFEGSIQT
jgi:hypothetical protein